MQNRDYIIPNSQGNPCQICGTVKYEIAEKMKLPAASCGISAPKLVFPERCKQRGIKPMKE